MKRFWTSVEVLERASSFVILLDAREIKTPARLPLLVPSMALAEAVADEWRAVEDIIDPRRMPLTGLANAAIDRIAPDPGAIARELGRYAEADLACYRADGPRELVARQTADWDKLLQWARRRYDVDFEITSGLLHVDQPAATVEQLRHAVAALDPFRLAGLSPLVTIGGSLLAALAVLEGALSPDEAWQAVSLDDRWQLEQWGSDGDAEAALESRRHDFFAACRFLDLLD